MMIFKPSRVLRDKHTFAIFHPHLNQCKVKRVNNENMILLSPNHSFEEEQIYKRISKVLRGKEGDELILFTNSSSSPISTSVSSNDQQQQQQHYRKQKKKRDASENDHSAALNLELPIVHQLYQIVQVNRSACLMRPLHPTLPFAPSSSSSSGHHYHQELSSASPSPYPITMCTGMLSKRESWEEQLYACAQVGIHHIQPILPPIYSSSPSSSGASSVASPVATTAIDQQVIRYYTNQERITKVVVSACEQAKQLQRFPIISPPKTLLQVMNEMRQQQKQHYGPLYHKKLYLDVNGQYNVLDVLNELRNNNNQKKKKNNSAVWNDDDSDDSENSDSDDSDSEEDDDDEELQPLVQEQKRIMIMLGPEADWTQQEKSEMLNNNFESVTISNKVVFRSQDCTQIIAGALATIL